MNLTQLSARCAVEQLKRGVFPPDEIEHFTAGRSSECCAIASALKEAEQGANRHLFLEASYGLGKSHMLKVAESVSLRKGFAVCWVTNDGYAHAFNHPTRYLHTFLENMRFPGIPRPGLAQACSHWLKNSERERLLTWSNGRPRSSLQWPVRRLSEETSDDDYKDYYLSTLESRDLQYRNCTPNMFEEVCNRITATTSLCRAVGLNGTVFLFDEVESIATLLSSIRSRLLSYQVLNTFIDARKFPNSCFIFATTLDFDTRIKNEFQVYNGYAYEYSGGKRFVEKWLAQELNVAKLKYVGITDNRRLLNSIRAAHSQAYQWAGADKISDDFIDRFLQKVQSQPQREITRGFVHVLEICQQNPECSPEYEFLGLLPSTSKSSGATVTIPPTEQVAMRPNQ